MDELFESFGHALTGAKRDFLAKSLFEMLSECDRQGIGVSLFLASLGDALGHERGSEWKGCLSNLERASMEAHSAERTDNLTRKILGEVRSS